MRNSTEKFRQKYSSSPRKQSIQCEQFSQQTSVFASPISTLSLKKQKSTPKLQTITQTLIKTQIIPLKKRRKIWDKQEQKPFTEVEVNKITEDIKKLKGLDSSVTDSFKKETKIRKQNLDQSQSQRDEQFIQKMAKNSLFFCCSCYQYIFQIEKNRHYPDCKDQIGTSSKDISKIAFKRLQRLLELSQYTETNPDKIRELYNNYTIGQTQSLNELKFSKKRFYQLKDIQSAFACIYHTFLKNIRYIGEGFFVCY